CARWNHESFDIW
nr:immunoglobulin heavy chain junction region [Macaca mulatta]